MSAMELHESILKYGDTDASVEKEYSCLTSSMHKSTYPPITKSDLDSHDSSVSLRLWLNICKLLITKIKHFEDILKRFCPLKFFSETFKK